MTDPMPPAPGSDPGRYFVRADPAAARELRPGVALRAVAGDALMLSVVTFEPGAEVPDHAHPHEQMGIMLSGRLEFTIASRNEVLEVGDIWRIPSNVPHRARALGGPAVALDVFHPVREDYRSPGDR